MLAVCSRLFSLIGIVNLDAAYLSQSGHPVVFMLALSFAFHGLCEDVYLLEHVETSTN